jgi:signal transduction histidine kinase
MAPEGRAPRAGGCGRIGPDAPEGRGPASLDARSALDPADLDPVAYLSPARPAAPSVSPPPRPRPAIPAPDTAADLPVRDPAPDGGPDYDELPDGVVIADADGRVVVFNRAAARITRTDPAAALGSALAEALPLQDLEGRPWWRCVDPYGGLAIRTGHPEVRLLLPGGRDVLVTARFVRAAPDQAPRRVVVGLRDTSARARVERRHADLIATVAHELRSPLTSVKGFTATLLAKWERFTDDQRKLMLETVDADADRVTRLIAELLDIARIDSGRLTLARQRVDLPELIREEVAGMVAAGLPADRFTLDVPDLPLIEADADKLRQVLDNLLENAVRHGEGRVTIRVEAVARTGAPPAATGREDERAMVAVTVDDEGPGIPHEALGRVFTRFWRGNRRGGTGLGLYIVKGIIEAHGGAITVGHTPGGGARFRFTIPA